MRFASVLHGTSMNLPEIQSALRSQKFSGWLIYDFRGGNPILAAMVSGKRFSTRRVFLWIPESGDPALILHTIDLVTFRDVNLPVMEYRSWQQMHEILRNVLGQTIAMEYSPLGELPAVSYADAGTVELIRSFGIDVVSSADLIQLTIARWSAEALREHRRASEGTSQAMRGAFEIIRRRLGADQPLDERQVQRFILDHFKRAGLETMDHPIVAVNAHAGDPHFEVSATSSAPIAAGDWVLIDLWARVPGDQNVYSDITWVGYCGRDVPPRHQQAWETTRAARDAALKLAVDSWKSQTSVHGWQLDDAARRAFVAAGCELNVRHRTGHSLSPGPKVHGMGMNLDNLESRDTRLMLPGIGFTIEPAIYFDDFGVRSEINVFVDPANGPIVTSCVQDEIEIIAR
jgi:Xaa-Pro aminopeptidase